MKPKPLWIARYYAYNALLGRCGGFIEAARLGRYSDRWNGIREDLGPMNEVLVVGNGPSLSGRDLECLSAIPAIASNKIFLLYEKTQWRPVLYTINDPLLAFKLRRYGFQEVPLVLCGHRIRPMLAARHAIAWRSVPFNRWKQKQQPSDFLPHPITGIFAACTITGVNIQLALWLGAKTIYLIGCDHFYKEEGVDKIGAKLVHGTTSNHFHPEYRSPGEVVNNAAIDKMDRDYAIVGEMARRMRARVINISRNTALEIFERNSVEQVARHGTPISDGRSRPGPGSWPRRPIRELPDSPPSR